MINIYRSRRHAIFCHPIYQSNTASLDEDGVFVRTQSKLGQLLLVSRRQRPLLCSNSKQRKLRPRQQETKTHQEQCVVYHLCLHQFTPLWTLQTAPNKLFTSHTPSKSDTQQRCTSHSMTPSSLLALPCSPSSSSSSSSSYAWSNVVQAKKSGRPSATKIGRRVSWPSVAPRTSRVRPTPSCPLL